MTQVRCARVATCTLSERSCAHRFVLASRLTRGTRDGHVTWSPPELAGYAICHGCPDGYERSMRLRIDPPPVERQDVAIDDRRLEAAADWGNVQAKLRRAHADRGREPPSEHDDPAEHVAVDASPERMLVALEQRDRWRSIVRGILERSEAFGAEHNADGARAERADYAKHLSVEGPATGVGRCGWAKELVRSRKGRAKRLRQLAAIVAAETVGAGELWRRRRARIADQDVYFADPRRMERARALLIARSLGYRVGAGDGRSYPGPRVARIAGTVPSPGPEARPRS